VQSRSDSAGLGPQARSSAATPDCRLCVRPAQSLE
jgi:hypothetical protein